MAMLFFVLVTRRGRSIECLEADSEGLGKSMSLDRNKMNVANQDYQIGQCLCSKGKHTGWLGLMMITPTAV